MAIKASFHYQGIPIHLVYTPLDTHIFSWDLDIDKYRSSSPDLIKLSERLLRQIYSTQIQHDLMQHYFYHSQLPLTGENTEGDVPW